MSTAHVEPHHHHHGHAHGHNHHHGVVDAPLRALVTALSITTIVFVAEIIGGWISGSMALIADAMHMLSDAAGLIIAVLAVLAGRRKASGTATFGYRRVEVLAALVNAATVIGIALVIVVEAVRRLRFPEPVEPRTMMGVAVIGLVANIASAWVLSRHRGTSINVEGAYLHVLVDLLGSVAVIVAGVVIMLTDFTAADVVASLVIAAMVLPRAWQLLRNSAQVLLEQVPPGFAADEVEPALRDVPGVAGIHDLHLWSLDGVSVLATVHVVVEDDTDAGALLDAVQERLHALGIDHSTIQLERPEHLHHESICQN
ncbi:cation diffusion facilitator family transporter [Corynebacterium sp. TA-R-1]|uniref:Cation diffusion facilitator family transporter n=1 Tax=Corynebacterium stercoris TaxID=2943490 RepID=A0ABT1FZR0_9CORY|nr:cation diffusion facilitator family transporter [Corynebacterium stercoris]MCP1387264.1 cation diffusion facilitator family transporter [Corynebacterium stercoris]